MQGFYALQVYLLCRYSGFRAEANLGHTEDPQAVDR